MIDVFKITHDVYMTQMSYLSSITRGNKYTVVVVVVLMSPRRTYQSQISLWSSKALSFCT